ncbi:MAG: magnesium/cobalt transporter CorA [Nitrospiraceae bacterium]|jgi:magnesium transporter|nr:magnesium/cobalt transporter CorA [Nitrospiraceae bacterium]
MERPARGRAKKTGLPAGALMHTGERKSGDVRIDLMEYNVASLHERQLSGLDACLSFRHRETITWLNVDGLHDAELMGKIGSCFSLHPLVLEDVLSTDQRPKYEDYDEYLYIVVRMLRYDADVMKAKAEQVSIILSQNYVLTFQEGFAGDVFEPVRTRLREDKGRLRKMGADYLAYSLLDTIVDNYFIVLDQIGERIELLENELVTNPTRKTLRMIHTLRGDALFLRRAVWPLREVINSFTRGDSPFITDATRLYLKDVYDHTIHAIDTLETYREILSGMLDIYLSSMSNRLNEVMKVLTIIATIFMPLTFLAGVYGMNFKHMPELAWQWSYPALWLIMIAIAGTMLIIFRRKKWI